MTLSSRWKLPPGSWAYLRRRSGLSSRARPLRRRPTVSSAARARCRRWLSSGGERCAEAPRDCALELAQARTSAQNFTCDYLGIAFDEIEEASPDPRERLPVRGVRLAAILEQGD